MLLSTSTTAIEHDRAHRYATRYFSFIGQRAGGTSTAALQRPRLFKRFFYRIPCSSQRISRFPTPGETANRLQSSAVHSYHNLAYQHFLEHPSPIAIIPHNPYVDGEPDFIDSSRQLHIACTVAGTSAFPPADASARYALVVSVGPIGPRSEITSSPFSSPSSDVSPCQVGTSSSTTQAALDVPPGVQAATANLSTADTSSTPAIHPNSSGTQIMSVDTARPLRPLPTLPVQADQPLDLNPVGHTVQHGSPAPRSPTTPTASSQSSNSTAIPSTPQSPTSPTSTLPLPGSVPNTVNAVGSSTANTHPRPASDPVAGSVQVQRVRPRGPRLPPYARAPRASTSPERTTSSAFPRRPQFPPPSTVLTVVNVVLVITLVAGIWRQRNT
ncbi:hypothetical protein PENSPDRAFT_690287 [Peniophora sp. CONT]|nr:hypothetical protein PENSPDRAFT_690287 [Peniophora sp. CONT]